MTANEIKDRTARGIKWNLLEQTGVYGITLVGTVVLSRLLLPEEYGLFGMLTVFANLATLVVGMGLGYSVIQNKDLTLLDLSSIFWFNLFLGTSVSVIFFICAPWIAGFYYQNELTSITRWFCLVFIIQGAGSIPQGLLIKAVNFKKFAFAQVTAALLSYCVAVGMAFNDFGVWSLLGQAITFHACSVSLNTFFSKWIPSFHFSIAAIKKIKSFSLNFFFSQLIDFSATNLDAVLIGKYFGKRDLGFLGRATALAMLPVTSFGFVLNRTFFPWFASLQHDKGILQQRYLQASKALMLTIVPVLILIGILSRDVVLLLFGNQWVSIAPLVLVFTIYASVSCFNSFHDSFIISQGRTDLLLRLNIVEKSILVISILIALRFGLLGIVWAKTIVTAVMFLPRLILVSNLVCMNWWMWFKTKVGLFMALSLLFSISWLLNMVLDSQFFIIRMVLVTLVSVSVYYLFLVLIEEKSVHDVQHNLISQMKSVFSKKSNP